MSCVVQNRIGSDGDNGDVSESFCKIKIEFSKSYRMDICIGYPAASFSWIFISQKGKTVKIIELNKLNDF